MLTLFAGGSVKLLPTQVLLVQNWHFFFSGRREGIVNRSSLPRRTAAMDPKQFLLSMLMRADHEETACHRSVFFSAREDGQDKSHAVRRGSVARHHVVFLLLKLRCCEQERLSSAPPDNDDYLTYDWTRTLVSDDAKVSMKLHPSVCI